MIVRFLTQKDIQEHDKVSSQAFSIACDINDKDSVLPCEKVLGAFDDDNKTLFADLELNEWKCNYGEKILTCAAVGGVAAKPEHRGKGAVKELFNFLFDMNEYDVSILYPFSEEYYRKLGYEEVGKSIEATIPFAELRKIKRNNDVTLYDGADTEKLLKIYNNCAKKYNLSFVRENVNEYSDEPYLSKKYTYIWKENSYATIMIDREKSLVNVSEIYFDSCESLLGILGFLRNFEGNQNAVCFLKIPCNSPILNFVCDTKNCNIKMYNTGSARILNIENVLKAHKYPQEKGEFTIRICDEIFCVNYCEKNVEILKKNDADPDVIMDINIASKILLSGVENAEYLPDIEIKNSDSDFFKAFPKVTAFFTNEY